jgi:hypothetical protein
MTVTSRRSNQCTIIHHQPSILSARWSHLSTVDKPLESRLVLVMGMRPLRQQGNESARERDIRESLERTQRMSAVWKRARRYEAELIAFGLVQLKYEDKQ